VFSHDCDGDDHARWQHIVASHEATDTLHREMCLEPYLPGGMVVAIAVNFVTFYYIVVVELNYLQGYFIVLY
jgi:hypothetical protein